MTQHHMLLYIIVKVLVCQLSGDEPLSLSVLLLPPDDEMGDEPGPPDGTDGLEPGKVLPEEVEDRAGADEPLLPPSMPASFDTVLELT